MSKNVAVFVDVANIFYAAKAAGVDIDYVTLLKSATANRDFVRAYAYTGLDPENENQRQFHAFLARSGYKVVSKDIRKYGDGRVKANLDIELVVDMMRMAEKLDIAIVVSGDGDFAPAINAVQQKGVRVEVISFRGNTSSDLIDAADVFIDITSVAKVEKGARSGRRVASDGDLSMTQVPDKESGVKPRRRRRSESDDAAEKPERGTRTRRRAGRKSEPEKLEKADEAEVPGAAALVALPGEKLSRGADAAEVPAEAEPATDEPSETDEQSGEGAGRESDELSGEGAGRRRRRRRGGRGRGRGGRSDAAEESSEPPSEAADAAPEYADEVPTLPQHSGFGSVWDSQIGVPADTAPAASVEDAQEGDELEDEPEVAEYLLTEKKQGRRRGGRGGRGGRSGGGYRSAIDRERYGVGSGSSRSGRGQSRSAGTPRASAQSMEPIEQTPGGDPWSEVPPEVQEMLKAELARRETPAPDVQQSKDAEQADEQPKKRTTRKRTAKKAAQAEAPAEDVQEAEATAEGQPKKRTTRKRTTKKAAQAEAPAEDAQPAEEQPKKRTTRKRTTKKAAQAEAPAEDAPAEEQPKKRTTRKRTTKKAAEAEAPAEDA